MLTHLEAGDTELDSTSFWLSSCPKVREADGSTMVQLYPAEFWVVSGGRRRGNCCFLDAVEGWGGGWRDMESIKKSSPGNTDRDPNF